MTKSSLLEWCNYVPFQTVEVVLYPVTALTWVCTVCLSLGSIVALVLVMNHPRPLLYQQFELPGFETRDSFGGMIEWIFWTLVMIVGCGIVTQVMTLLSWIVRTHVFCAS